MVMIFLPHKIECLSHWLTLNTVTVDDRCLTTDNGLGTGANGYDISAHKIECLSHWLTLNTVTVDDGCLTIDNGLGTGANGKLVCRIEICRTDHLDGFL